MKLNKDLRTLYPFAIIWCIIIIIFVDISIPPDGPGYIKAWDVFVNGKIDILRTPVYPIYLGVFKTLFGSEHFLLFSVIGQHIIYLISIYFFYKIAILITNSKNVSFYLTLFYTFFPGLCAWCNTIQTESLAISCNLFFVYWCLLLYQKGTIKRGFFVALWLSLLIMLRPIFLYLLPVWGVLWILCIFQTKKKIQAIYGLVGVAFAFCLLLVYMFAFKKAHGIFAPTSVGTINNYYIARQYGLIDPSVIKNKALKLEIQESIKKHGQCWEGKNDQHPNGKLWGEVHHFFDDNYSLKTMQDAVGASIKKNPIKRIKILGEQAYNGAPNRLFVNYVKGWLYQINQMFNFITGIRINNLYTFLLLYSLVLFCWMYKNKVFAWYSLCLLLMGISNVIIVIFGAQQEWGRLLLPSQPLFIIMLGQLCMMFKVKSFSLSHFK